MISNLTLKHMHLGINIIFTSHNPKSFPNITRNNVDIFCLYKIVHTKILLEKLYGEVNSFLTREEFESFLMLQISSIIHWKFKLHLLTYSNLLTSLQSLNVYLII